MEQRKIIQVDPTTSAVIAEHANADVAAKSVGKDNGSANIMLCCGYNHLAKTTARKAYGFSWRFSE